MHEVVIDFETANPVLEYVGRGSSKGLAYVGSHAYSKHWATEVLCLGYHNNDVFGSTDRLGLWCNDRSLDCIQNFAEDPQVIFIAHNAGFEKDIWRNIMVPIYGLPNIPNNRWHDTMASALLRGLPGSLEKLLIALGLPGKDLVGSKLTRQLSRYNKRGYLDRTEATLQRVYEYCLKDVADEVAVHKKLGYLPPAEREVWLVDQEINERGLRFDLDMCRGATAILEELRPGMIEEFRELTGGLNPTQVGAFKVWLASRGVEVKNLRKETLVGLLEVDDEDDRLEGQRRFSISLPTDCRRALTIRELIGSSSVSKYERMVACSDTDDQRIYRLLQYHGAGTGRWAGRLLNPHNMPRGITRDASTGLAPEIQRVATAIRSADPRAITELGLVKDDGSSAHPIEVLASALRGTVVARPGNVLIVGDWSNIEARFVLALAGQRDKIALMASGHDVYCDMATVIFHEPVTKKDVERRQTGKNTVLGCGFQMGWPKFLERYCPKETPVFARDVVNAYRKEWAPQVPVMWAGLQGAALGAVRSPGVSFASHGIEYRVEGSWLVGHCPDGSCLYYYQPTICRQRASWKEIEEDGTVVTVLGDWTDAWRYQVPHGKTNAERVGPAGQWVYAYGGLLTENYVQHMARQKLCQALLECRHQGIDVVLHNQDEIIAEVPDWLADENILKEIMEEQPEWLKPYAVDPNGNQIKLIQAEMFEPTDRYHK